MQIDTGKISIGIIGFYRVSSWFYRTFVDHPVELPTYCIYQTVGGTSTYFYRRIGLGWLVTYGFVSIAKCSRE